MKIAFEALEAADPKDLDRAVLAQTGMRKRKQCPKHWQPERFKGIAKEELKRFQRNCEDDEHRDYSTFVAVTSDRKELERRLRDLQDRGHHLDIETKMLRNRAEQVRERVANEIT
eukprot:s548_g3.t1